MRKRTKLNKKKEFEFEFEIEIEIELEYPEDSGRPVPPKGRSTLESIWRRLVS